MHIKKSDHDDLPCYEVHGSNIAGLNPGEWHFRSRSLGAGGTYAWVAPEGTDAWIEVVIEELHDQSEEAALWRESNPLRLCAWVKVEIEARLADEDSWLRRQIAKATAEEAAEEVSGNAPSAKADGFLRG